MVIKNYRHLWSITFCTTSMTVRKPQQQQQQYLSFFSSFRFFYISLIHFLFWRKPIPFDLLQWKHRCDYLYFFILYYTLQFSCLRVFFRLRFYVSMHEWIHPLWFNMWMTTMLRSMAVAIMVLIQHNTSAFEQILLWRFEKPLYILVGKMSCT